MLAKMKAIPQLRDVASDQQTESTTLTLTVNRDQASRYGLTAQMIDDTLYDAFGQRQIAQYFTQLASYEVVMEVVPSLQGDIATLDQIFLKSPTTGGEVPLPPSQSGRRRRFNLYLSAIRTSFQRSRLASISL